MILFKIAHLLQNEPNLFSYLQMLGVVARPR